MWHLDPGDKIQKSYSGELDDVSGYLIMSNEKLLFIHEEGFLHKTEELTLDLPYKNIDKISRLSKFGLDISEVGGKKHHFWSGNVNVEIIEKSLEKLK
jgi:hypothetical protein